MSNDKLNHDKLVGVDIEIHAWVVSQKVIPRESWGGCLKRKLIEAGLMEDKNLPYEPRVTCQDTAEPEVQAEKEIPEENMVGMGMIDETPTEEPGDIPEPESTVVDQDGEE